MKNRHSFYLRYVLSLFVFLFLLSFIADTGIGQEFPNQSGLKAQIGEGGKLAKQKLQRIREAIRIQKMNTEWLLDIAHVVGTATGIGADGEPEIRVFAAKAGIRGIPENLDGFSVKTKVTGRFYALDCPNGPTGRCDRPVPIGVSTGHPDITAGTIGARVTDGTNVYALSNNHVYAAINDGTIGDEVIQPGAFDDGGLPADFIGTLYAYEEIKFCTVWWIWLICSETNAIDAAIANVVDPSTGEQLVETMTLPDGYGSPNSILHPAFGDPKLIDDAGEDLVQLLGQPVQKYGRTTGLTYGTVDSINATINVCYDEACLKVARFADQIIIIPGSFSGGGDSGSLIVTNDANKYPVGLLFAGSDTETIANRIDLVLYRFGVTIDSGPTLPSLTINDVAVNEGDEGTIDAVFTVSLSAPSSEAVTFDFFTEDDTATAGSDYMYTADTLTFDIGETAQTIAVPVSGDREEEGDETFYVNLTSATGATIVDGQGVGTIRDDDAPPLPPEISIDDISVKEGAAFETKTAVFTVTLSDSSALEVSVQYTTVEGEGEGAATADEDYVTTSGTLVFQPGTTTLEIRVQIKGDDKDEPDEIFYVDLFSVVNASIADGQGEGTILDDDEPAPASGPHLRTGTVTASSDGWTTVIVDPSYSYKDMVVICTPHYAYDYNLTSPAVVRIQNAGGNSFDVGLAPAVFWLGNYEPPRIAEVHWMAVEAGVYNEAEHGVKMEAAKFVSTVTDNYRSWVGQSKTYGQAYTNPVVVGQVMTYNADRPFYWSVFWSRGSSASSPPSSGVLRVGKHQGQDNRLVNDETIAYVVIEAGSGSIEGTSYVAALGSDTIRGIGNSPPYRYSLNGLSNPTTAIASQAGMDDKEGGWAILHGDPAVTQDWVEFCIDEDWYWDSERRHTTEQVGYIVFD